jgi:hypothetical protein
MLTGATDMLPVVARMSGKFMTGITQQAFGLLGGVSQQAVAKAATRGYLVRDEAGRLDPGNKINKAWLELHRQGFDDRGRPLDTHVGGRPPHRKPAGAWKAVSPASGASRRNGASAVAAAPVRAFSDAALDQTLATLSAQLELDEPLSGRDLAVLGGAAGHDPLSSKVIAAVAALDLRLRRIEAALFRVRS